MNDPTQTEYEAKSYEGATFVDPIRLDLSRNEGSAAVREQPIAKPYSQVNRYPSMATLTKLLATNYQVGEAQVVVTAGGDQAIESVFRRTALGTDGTAKVLTHSPSFEMLDVYANNVKCRKESVVWLEGSFPVDDFKNKLGSVDLAVIVSPNNPTGSALSTEEIVEIAEAARAAQTLLLVDLAYIEFNDSDPTSRLLAFENVVMIRSLSKAWGLAGLRIGAAISSNEKLISDIESIRGPFPVSSESIQIAEQALAIGDRRMVANVEQVRSNRGQLVEFLNAHAVSTLDTSANFVTAKFSSADEMKNKLAKQGTGVRSFPSSNHLADCLRITIPAEPFQFAQLISTLSVALDIPDPAPKKTVGTETGRQASVERKTNETDIQLKINLDGTGSADIKTGLGFFDHMLTALTCHGRFDLTLHCDGDTEVDDHHTVEDCAIALGDAFRQALGDKRGVYRFATAHAPLDEALVRCVVDLSGRADDQIELGFVREAIGVVATENLTHFFVSFAANLRCALHLDLIRGTNDHHKAEAAFKALALALREAVTIRDSQIPSTKGVV